MTDQCKRVDLPFRRAVYPGLSSGADLHQVEQPLIVPRLFWPVDVEGGGAKVLHALSQIDYL